MLQKNENSIDDGSISYASAWRKLPYVNIEVLLGDAGKQAQMITTLNQLLEKYPQLATDMNFVPKANAITAWEKFEKDVRDGKLSKKQSKPMLDGIVNSLRDFSFAQYPMLRNDPGKWAFPRQNGTIKNLIYGRGDYHPNSPPPAYDFFDGNAHGGHPALDISINERELKIDKNNDGFVDSTGEPVMGVAVVDAIVVSTYIEWKHGSDLKGGNYVWLYSPYLDRFFYHAHFHEVFVRIGQFVSKGQPIGAIGRTGKRAEGTECHIHLMVLQHVKDNLIPVDYYGEISGNVVNHENYVRALYFDLRKRYNISDGEYALITLGEYQKMFLVSGNKDSATVHKEYDVSTGKFGFGTVPHESKTPVGVMRIKAKIGDNAQIGSVFESLRFTGKVVKINYESEDHSHPLMTTRLMVLEGMEKQNREFTLIRIHGTQKEGKIGHQDSGGCIRMRNNEVIELFDTLPKAGTYVYIVPKSNEIVASTQTFSNILIIGSDMMTGREKMGERGDALILVSTEANEKTVRVLSIPRDTYVPIRGKMTKINHALAYGGWRLQKETMEKFLNVRVDKVILLDYNNLRDLFYTVRQEAGTFNIMKDLTNQIGYAETAKIMGGSVGDDEEGLGFGSVMRLISNRKFANAAVGRAKNHAKIVAALISILKDYFNDPSKRKIFEDDFITRILNLVKYTDMTPQDVKSAMVGWSQDNYKVKTYYVPGRPQNIDNVSYWIAQDFEGGQSYFDKVINNKQSIV